MSGFRPTMTAEEIIVDFGLNLIHPTGNKEHPYELVFQASNRLIMSYYSAKRLTITLSQIVRRFEQQFGQIELNAAQRQSALQAQPASAASPAPGARANGQL